LKKLDFSDIDKVKDWVDLALLDISAARKLYKSENGLALYHLQQGIEKLLKASLIYTGFKKESTVITLNHKPQNFAIELLNDPDICEVIYNRFPFKRIKKPKKPSKEEMAEIESLVNIDDKIQALDKGDDIVKGISSLLGCPNPLLFEPNELGNLTKEFMEKIVPKKELDKFIEECNASPIKYEEMIYNVSNYCFIAINTALFLLPLNIGMWAFESVPRYPDEYRKMAKKFEDYESHKAFYTIINQVEKFGECFRNYLK